MPLTPGTRLGPVRHRGAHRRGWHGRNLSGQDTNLDRDVAIKVLPDLFASDPERLARFEREAKTLAAFNHPNIGQIHGLEISGGIRALVMELVDGDDLSQRIAPGRFPHEALPIARQIAEPSRPRTPRASSIAI